MAESRTSPGGSSYYWNYSVGSRYRPRIAELSIDADIAFTFTLENEGAGHRLAAVLGLTSNFQTGDPAFDDQIYIVCDDKEWCRLLHDNATLRQIVRDLFTRDIKSLSSKEGRLSVSMQEITPVLDDETADFLVQKLADLKRHMPAKGNVPYSVSNEANQKRATFFRCVWVVVLLAGIILFSGSRQYPVMVHPLELVPLGAICALAAIAFGLLLIGLVFGRSSYGYGVLKTFIVYGVTGLTMGCFTGVYYMNVHWDSGRPSVYDQPIIDKYDAGVRGHSYHIFINDWRDPGATYKLYVGARYFGNKEQPALYQKAAIGKHVRIAIHPGYFSSEWVEVLDILP